MKMLRCRMGFHREMAVEGFPLGSRNALVVGVKCSRCGRHRCVSNMSRPNPFTPGFEEAFDQAQDWLERVTGQRVFGPFVGFR